MSIKRTEAKHVRSSVNYVRSLLARVNSSSDDTMTVVCMVWDDKFFTPRSHRSFVMLCSLIAKPPTTLTYSFLHLGQFPPPLFSRRNDLPYPWPCLWIERPGSAFRSRDGHEHPVPYGKTWRNHVLLANYCSFAGAAVRWSGRLRLHALFACREESTVSAVEFESWLRWYKGNEREVHLELQADPVLSPARIIFWVPRNSTGGRALSIRSSIIRRNY